ncbi:hypothetical protein SCFA_3710004 [anaerobic digester metagenome]|uniref:Uncharacterized protein n=1 Tax=anaerobic digester metagenome TaxID=1263854 RepID=A0A485M5N9_9ZZZZ
MGQGTGPRPNQFSFNLTPSRNKGCFFLDIYMFLKDLCYLCLIAQLNLIRGRVDFENKVCPY